MLYPFVTPPETRDVKGPRCVTNATNRSSGGAPARRPAAGPHGGMIPGPFGADGEVPSRETGASSVRPAHTRATHDPRHKFPRARLFPCSALDPSAPPPPAGYRPAGGDVAVSTRTAATWCPASSRRRTQPAAVAPVVRTSSMTTTSERGGRISSVRSTRCPARFRSRSPGFRPTESRTPRRNARQSALRVSDPAPDLTPAACAPIRAMWEPPLRRAADLLDGAGTRWHVRPVVIAPPCSTASTRRPSAMRSPSGTTRSRRPPSLYARTARRAAARYRPSAYTGGPVSSNGRRTRLSPPISAAHSSHHPVPATPHPAHRLGSRRSTRPAMGPPVASSRFGSMRASVPAPNGPLPDRNAPRPRVGRRFTGNVDGGWPQPTGPQPGHPG